MFDNDTSVSQHCMKCISHCTGATLGPRNCWDGRAKYPKVPKYWDT